LAYAIQKAVLDSKSWKCFLPLKVRVTKSQYCKECGSREGKWIEVICLINVPPYNMELPRPHSSYFCQIEWLSFCLLTRNMTHDLGQSVYLTLVITWLIRLGVWPHNHNLPWDFIHRWNLRKGTLHFRLKTENIHAEKENSNKSIREMWREKYSCGSVLWLLHLAMLKL
jgi:hypothetical protein